MTAIAFYRKVVAVMNSEVPHNPEFAAGFALFHSVAHATSHGRHAPIHWHMAHHLYCGVLIRAA